MEWVSERDQHEAFQVMRDQLLDRFFEAGHEDQVVGRSSLLLDWKFGYSDGDLVTWTTGHLDEMLLDWAPRKVSMPAREVRPLIADFQQFFAFLAAQNLLGLGSSAWKSLDAHLASLVKPVEHAMGDSSRFGPAKSFVAGTAKGDTVDVPDEHSLRAMLERLAGMHLEERVALLGSPIWAADPWLALTDGVDMLPAAPVPADVVSSFVAEAPFFNGIETIRDFVGVGRKLTAKGNLNVADTKLLASLLFPELADGGTPRFDVRSADDIPLQQFMLRFARMAGATKVVKGTLSATASWKKKDPVERITRAVIDVLDEGPVELSRGHGQWSDHGVDELIDDGVVHILAVLWAVDEFPLEDLVEAAVEIARMTLSWRDTASPDIVPIVVRATFDRLLRVLGSFGLVVQYDAFDDDGGPEGEPALSVLDDVDAGGILALTEFGRAILPAYLRRHGYVIPEAGGFVGGSLRDLFEHLDEWQPGRVSFEFALWVRALPSEVVIDELAGVADSGDPLWRLCAAHLAQELPAELVEPALRRLLGTRSRGQAIAALRDLGADDVPDDREAQVLAGVDLFAQLLHEEDTEDFVALISAIDDLEDFIDEVWRIPEPHAGDLLGAIGRMHPDKHLAKLARTAVVRHRSRLANTSHLRSVPRL